MKNIKIPATIDKAANLGKPAAKKEHEITVLDAGNLWNQLAARYDTIESLMIMMNYAEDKHLHKQLQDIHKQFNRQSRKLEKQWRNMLL